MRAAAHVVRCMCDPVVVQVFTVLVHCPYSGPVAPCARAAVSRVALWIVSPRETVHGRVLPKLSSHLEVRDFMNLWLHLGVHCVGQRWPSRETIFMQVATLEQVFRVVHRLIADLAAPVTSLDSLAGLPTCEICAVTLECFVILRLPVDCPHEPLHPSRTFTSMNTDSNDAFMALLVCCPPKPLCTSRVL